MGSKFDSPAERKSLSFISNHKRKIPTKYLPQIQWTHSFPLSVQVELASSDSPQHFINGPWLIHMTRWDIAILERLPILQVCPCRLVVLDCIALRVVSPDPRRHQPDRLGGYRIGLGIGRQVPCLLVEDPQQLQTRYPLESMGTVSRHKTHVNLFSP